MASWPHSPDTDSVPFAPSPSDPHAWPLPGTPIDFSTQSFGGARKWGCWEDDTCVRWHAGVDLRNAPKDAKIVAPEDAIVAGVNKGWTPSTRATYLRTASGLFVVLGGFVPGSSTVNKGDAVSAGQELGRVSGAYKQLHLETYQDAESRNSNSQWPIASKPPSGLLNPLHYVQRLAGQTLDEPGVEEPEPDDGQSDDEKSGAGLAFAGIAAAFAVWWLGRS